jgi:hypothetical protein
VRHGEITAKKKSLKVKFGVSVIRVQSYDMHLRIRIPHFDDDQWPAGRPRVAAK